MQPEPNTAAAEPAAELEEVPEEVADVWPRISSALNHIEDLGEVEAG